MKSVKIEYGQCQFAGCLCEQSLAIWEAIKEIAKESKCKPSDILAYLDDCEVNDY